MSQSYDCFPPETYPYSSTSWVKDSPPHIFTGNTKCEQSTGSFSAWEGPLLSYTISSLTDDKSTSQLPSPPISPLSDCFSIGMPESVIPGVPSPVHYVFPTQRASISISAPATNSMSSIYVGGSTSPPKLVMKTEDDHHFGEQQHFDNSLPRSFKNKMAQRSSARSWRTARHAHTIIERNYRDRLNNKIYELSAYLFNEPISSGIKPSKSKVISQATDRLLHLEKQNQELLTEVNALKKQMISGKPLDKGQANQKLRTSDADEEETDMELDR